MKNVILYCRVSSDEQKTNTSLDFQEKKLRLHCDSNGYNVIACYKEDFSAKHHDFVRPEMKKIRDYCKAHKNEVDMILFLRWDRFARIVVARLQVLLVRVEVAASIRITFVQHRVNIYECLPIWSMLPLWIM